MNHITTADFQNVIKNIGGARVIISATTKSLSLYILLAFTLSRSLYAFERTRHILPRTHKCVYAYYIHIYTPVARAHIHYFRGGERTCLYRRGTNALICTELRESRGCCAAVKALARPPPKNIFKCFSTTSSSSLLLCVCVCTRRVSVFFPCNMYLLLYENEFPNARSLILTARRFTLPLVLITFPPPPPSTFFSFFINSRNAQNSFDRIT